MGIELFFSNQLEELADKYAAMVDLENRGRENIFQPSLAIVPNQNLKKWLQLTLSRKRPVFMNVEFQYLESGLWGLLADLDAHGERPQMLDSAFMRMLILRALQGLRQDDAPWSAPLRRYLLDADGERGPDYATRLWQLTERLTRLFGDYQFHRSGMIEAWVENRGRPKGMELCQKNLYLLLMALRDRYVQKCGRRVPSMGEYADAVLGAATAGPGARASRRFVHIFGLSQVSRFHLGLIFRLRDHYDLFIYTLNPCQEFWEDLRTPREKEWILRKNAREFQITPQEADSGELAREEENELLSLWGKPGRENIHLLCQLTDYDFNACFSLEQDRTSVLGELQRRILTLSSGERAGNRIAQDRSLQIYGCPGIYREVETVYNSILHNLETDEDLQMTDMAILVPDISRYKPVIDSVFNRSPRRLSYSLVDSRADKESLYGRAALGILDLAAGRFSRKEVFEFILNPCVMERWQVEWEDAGVWAVWVDRLNIFHSFDQEARSRRGYEKSPLYTWRQGLKRLALGRVMAPPEEGGGDLFRHFNGLVPFSDQESGDVELLEKFSVVVEKIHAAVRDLADLRAPGEEWRRRFTRICDDLIEIPSGLRGEAGVRESLMEALGELNVYDALKEKASDRAGQGLFDLDLFREFVSASLAAIPGGYGDYLTEGISVSALQPMRPIPFRIIYVLGMEEGTFPGHADRSSLDLRLKGRRIGDVSLPERNCYLFLETLLSARDRLYISYVARDLQKDRLIQPCSVINQLRGYVEREILQRGERFHITEVPLSGASERYLSPDALTRASDVLVNYSPADRIALLKEKGRLEEAIVNLPGSRGMER